MECPNCYNKSLLYYPMGYKKTDNKEMYECTKCDTQFNRSRDGKIIIFKRGNSILME